MYNILQTFYMSQERCTFQIYFISTVSSEHSLFAQKYRNDPKFSDRQVLANSADIDQTAPLGLHCLLFHLHYFDKLPSGLSSLYEF